MSSAREFAWRNDVTLSEIQIEQIATSLLRVLLERLVATCGASPLFG